MKIKSLIYEDQSTDWKLEQIDFNKLKLFKINSLCVFKHISVN